MQKLLMMLAVFFLLGFKCGSEKKVDIKKALKNDPSSVNPASDAVATRSASTDRVSGPLRAVVSGGMFYGDIKSFTTENVYFNSVDYGDENPIKYNVEHSIQDGLLMNEQGEIGAPIMVFIEVPDGKFPCSTMIVHDDKDAFCNHLVLETSKEFTLKMTNDADFRIRFGAMLGKNFEADSKNALFKVSDVR